MFNNDYNISLFWKNYIDLEKDIDYCLEKLNHPIMYWQPSEKINQLWVNTYRQIIEELNE